MERTQIDAPVLAIGSFVLLMVHGAKVSKDGWFAAPVALSVFGSRASVAVDAGIRSPMFHPPLQQQGLPVRGGTERVGHDQRQSQAFLQKCGIVSGLQKRALQGFGGAGRASQG